MVFDSFFSKLLGPVLNFPDPFGLLIISVLLTLFITLIYKYTTDQKAMKEMKDMLKEFQKEIKLLKDKPEKALEKQKEAMQINMKYMMASFKPMIFTFVPLVLVYGWLSKYYTALGNPDVFFGISWFWSYVIFSIVASMVLRKVLKVH
ncbi:DUF106 domain-containing protein [Candidatus Woesearchaeota archaeon]|nr:DUF106 domain-containing protein [Candidatus Woesearchaeota archaeon]